MKNKSTKLTKKLQLALDEFKESIEVYAMFNKDFEGDDPTWTHTLWSGCYVNHPGFQLTCHGGEKSNYWFKKRICDSELKAMVKANPKIEYFVFRCGSKLSHYTIIPAKKFASR
jgi:hypothetical protein